jgi:hypothetical protein
LTGKQTAGFMPLAEVKEKVRQDWQIENTNQAREKKIAELIKQYDVQVKL